MDPGLVHGFFIRNVPQWQIDQDLDMAETPESKNLLSYQKRLQKDQFDPDIVLPDQKLSEKAKPLICDSFKKQLNKSSSDDLKWHFCMKNFEVLQNGTIFNRFRSSDLIRQNVAISSLIFNRTNEIVRLKLEKTKFSGRFEIGLCQCLTDMEVLEKMEKLVSLKFISDEKGNHNFTSEGKSFISVENLKIIADLLFSQNENDVIQFWKRGDEILINFGKKLPPPKAEFLRDSDGSIWFELCRIQSPARIFIDSSFHDTGYITGTGNFPVLPLQQDELDQKMKNLASTDKNCPILTLTKEILQKLKIKESEFEKSNNGSLKVSLVRKASLC